MRALILVALVCGCAAAADPIREPQPSPRPPPFVPPCGASPPVARLDRPLIEIWLEDWKTLRACVTADPEKCTDRLVGLLVDSQAISEVLTRDAYGLETATTVVEREHAIERLDVDAHALEPFRTRP